MVPPAHNGLEERSFETRQFEPQELDELFDVLADEQRRCVLTSLSDAGGEATFDALVADVTRQLSTNRPGHGPFREIVTSLYHVHLPKLESVGLVSDYDPDGTVRLSDSVADIPMELVDSS